MPKKTRFTQGNDYECVPVPVYNKWYEMNSLTLTETLNKKNQDVSFLLFKGETHKATFKYLLFI